jgi:K+-sensing histidine kinase KdpD
MPVWTDLRGRYPLALALLGPLAAAALMVPLRNHVQNTDLALVMVVAVALLALPGWRVAAVVAGLSGGAWFDFFLTRPYERFSIQRSSDIQTTVLLAMVGILIGEVAARRRQARRDSIAARDEVLSLYVIAEMLAAGRHPDDIVASVAEQLQEVLFLEDCRFDPNVTENNDPAVDRDGELHYGRLTGRWPPTGCPTGT